MTHKKNLRILSLNLSANRTIKTITETKKHKYVRVKEYFLDKETNEWVLMYDEKMSWLIARPFITEDSVTEEIKEYHI